ncbi:MAG: hypothetical protein ACI8WA_001623 [Polaribacter sp.]|jgi:hypothetical protein
MIEKIKERQENKTIQEWFGTASIKDRESLIKVKQRKEDSIFYDFIFNIRVKYYGFKRRLNQFLFYILLAITK